MFLKRLIGRCTLLILFGTTALNSAEAPGFMEGQLKIVSPKTVELADGKTPTVTAETYAEYPLIIRSGDGKREITQVTADQNGHYRVELPAGDYILDVKGRIGGHVRATPQPFTVISKQSVQVNMVMDTGIR